VRDELNILPFSFYFDSLVVKNQVILGEKNIFTFYYCNELKNADEEKMSISIIR